MRSRRRPRSPRAIRHDEPSGDVKYERNGHGANSLCLKSIHRLHRLIRISLCNLWMQPIPAYTFLMPRLSEIAANGLRKTFPKNKFTRHRSSSVTCAYELAR